MKKTIFKITLAVGIIFVSAKSFSQETNVDNDGEDSFYLTHSCKNETDDTIKVYNFPSRVPNAPVHVIMKINNIEIKTEGSYGPNQIVNSEAFKLSESAIPYTDLSFVEQVNYAGHCRSEICPGAKTIKKALLKAADHEIYFNCK